MTRLLTAQLMAFMLLALTTVAQAESSYAIVVSRATYAGADWKKVVAVLEEKHNGRIFIYEKEPSEIIERLSALHPRHTCFVVRHREATRKYVATVHQLTRRFDDDPYTDTFWGILTGFDAANALDIAAHRQPLTVRKVASGTEIALEMCEEGLWYDELVKHKKVEKKPGGVATESRGPADTTQALVETLNDYQADLFVTSGHATERDWMIGFRYKNGFFKSSAGQMYGLDTQGKRIEVESDNPKIYLPIGNCLMGHIDGPDAMALAWMNDASVRQMIGYTVPTWFGYGGWGCLDYFVEQPGRYTLTEAFFANHHALVYYLTTGGRNLNRRGLEFDRDVVAFYGDPAWQARMADGKRAWEQELTSEKEAEGGSVFTFTISPNRSEATFRPVNTNGAQRGWRPIVQFFERRLTDFQVLEGTDLEPQLADDFLLIPNPRECDPNRKYVVRFRARPIEGAN